MQDTVMRTEAWMPVSQLRLWQIISPALPVGAYSYSQGMETAVEHAWVKTEQCALGWIRGQLHQMLGTLDLPVLLRMHKAWLDSDMQALHYWNSWLLAARESAELYAEDCQMGGSLRKLLPELGITRSFPVEEKCSFALMFALAAAEWGITPADAACGYAWAWCENQVAAALKLIPLGQTAGQRSLLALANEIPGIVTHAARLQDEEIGQVSPAFAIACALHETQYTRLFRS
jgi:urease accessory protein